MVEEEVVQRIPVTVQRMIYEEKVEQIPVRVCKMVSVEETVRTPRVVEKRIPVNYTYRVPRVVTMKVPVNPCEDTVAMPTTACCGETVVNPGVQIIRQEPYLSAPASGEPHPAQPRQGSSGQRKSTNGDADERPAIGPDERVPRPIDETEADAGDDRTSARGSVYDRIRKE
jgi:hypothetical protein